MNDIALVQVAYSAKYLLHDVLHMGRGEVLMAVDDLQQVSICTFHDYIDIAE